MEIKLAKTQKVLSPTQIGIADYVINPYRGCEFGCLYCYSQENKNIKKFDFLNSLYIKQNAPGLLERELRYTRPKMVLLGSTTECFQYQEIKYGITREILKILNKFEIPYTILTKSHLIKEYLDIISENKKNKIYFTLNFPSQDFIKAFEEKSPSLDERLKAIEKIIQKNINLRIHLGPYIPHISCLEETIKQLPCAVREIDVELYHQKMGNFSKILEKTESVFGADLKSKIAGVYAEEKKYREFADELKQRIIKKNKELPKTKFYLIAPEFDGFYNAGINYEKSV